MPDFLLSDVFNRETANDLFFILEVRFGEKVFAGWHDEHLRGVDDGAAYRMALAERTGSVQE